MSLDREPSPQRGGGWSSPGLSVEGMSGSFSSDGGRTVTWQTTKDKSNGIQSYPSFSTRNNGFFYRHARKISSSLPIFSINPVKNHRELEKRSNGKWHPNNDSRLGRLKTFIGGILRRARSRRFLTVFALLFCTILFYTTPMHHAYRKASHFGGGGRYVLVLGANPGGGVMDWKGPREWAIERESIKNKRKYARKWGYELEIVDMMTKKRYAHEWRESWEKVDALRNAMKKYPMGEWFWWLDLNTFIMEPSLSLQQHIFKDLQKNVYRDINIYNPLNIPHPFNNSWYDGISNSATGDNATESLDFLVSQDCGGFNLGSFFVRRSEWTDRLLDAWWDPVAYEQRHMEWEHKEQDALEYMYSAQPWIRSHMGFLPQRKINSFPLGACGEEPNPLIHYSEKSRDFLVNMAGCEWGRDCWGEMYTHRELSNKLNRNPWEKLKDWIVDSWKSRRQQRNSKQQTNDEKKGE